ncbi:adenosylcobyric acid synthase [Rhodoligotrophos appendicifer]
MPAVMDSFALVQAQADLVLVEGAGSASEINLRQDDIANMGFARASNTPVVLVGDIDRGGVIASLVGTRSVIDPLDARLIKGFIVNKMRGDRSLFDAGMRAISKASGWPALGLVPYFTRAKFLPAEDAFELEQRLSASARPAKLTIAVIMLPRISNFDDLDPLIAEPDVNLVFLKPGEVLPICDVVILPGSKSTISDLAELFEHGWDIDIKAHVRRGGRVLGICGGFQMLGREVRDPEGTEGPITHIEGLGLFDCVTVLRGEKLLREVEGLDLKDGVPFKGYEMHIGETRFDVPPDRFLKFSDGREDGAVSAHGRVQGTYVHGLFAHDGFRMAWLQSLGQAPEPRSHEAEVDAVLDELAAHLEEHMDIDQILKLAR